MNTMSLSARATCFLVLAAVFALGACQSTKAEAPKTAEISNEITASVEVVAVDAAARLISLEREDGMTFSVEAGRAVRNFDQIKVGDQLVVRYREKLVATKRSDQANADLAELGLVVARAKPGAKPSGVVSASLSIMVKIESIDLANDIVVFSLASGELIARNVKTQTGRAFIGGLERGNLVQLDYSEGVALSIEKKE